jgi:homoserine kinase
VAPASHEAPGTAIERVRVRVPATSANLGPGFDALGLALKMVDELDLAITAEPGLQVRAYGDVPTDETNLVVRAARAGFAAVGEQPTGLALAYTGTIPHARGLGSSAAAICAGVTAALALRGVDDRALALRIAYGLEPHPDNIAAALYGGLTVAWLEDGCPQALRLAPDPRVQPLAFIPQVRTSTEASRGALPASVTHVDAAANAGRAALLVAALTHAPETLLAATEDRLHQPYRLPGIAGGAELVMRLRGAGVPAVLSGSGPTILALCRDDAEKLRARALADTGYPCHDVPVDMDGTTVVRNIDG